jgi:hypothetical protein
MINSNNLSFVDLVKKLSNIVKTKHRVKSAIFVKSMLAIFFMKIDCVIALVALTTSIRTGDNIYENKYIDRYQDMKPVIIHINGTINFIAGLLFFSCKNLTS